MKSEKELAAFLKSCSSQEWDGLFTEATPSDLFRWLDSLFTLLGDGSAEELKMRGLFSEVGDAILGNAIRTSKGRIRALFVLHGFGNRIPNWWRPFEHALYDRSPGVVDNALFGLVFGQRQESKPLLQEILSSLKKEGERRDSFQSALESLDSRNPFLFSPYFSDDNNVWGLEREK